MATRPTHYATVAIPGTKKISICARRVGTRDRWNVIASCGNESTAEKIVDALNTLQGKIAELEIPAQRTLEEIRERLRKEIELVNALRREKSVLQNDLDLVKRQKGDVTFQKDRAEQERDRLRAEFAAYRDAHPAKVTEKA